jgi:hypothetical protein
MQHPEHGQVRGEDTFGDQKIKGSQERLNNWLTWTIYCGTQFSGRACIWWVVQAPSSKLYELAHKIPSMEKERREKTIWDHVSLQQVFLQ